MAVKTSENSPSHRNLPLFGRANDFLEPKHALINRAVYVSFTEGFSRRPKHCHLGSTSCNLKKGFKKKHLAGSAWLTLTSVQDLYNTKISMWQAQVDVCGLQLRGWIGNYILQHRGSLGCLVSEQDTAHEGLCGFLGVHRCGLPSTWRDDIWCLKKGFYHLAAQRDSKHIHHISWYEVLDMFKHCKKTIVKFMTEHEMTTIY